MPPMLVFFRHFASLAGHAKCFVLGRIQIRFVYTAHAQKLTVFNIIGAFANKENRRIWYCHIKLAAITNRSPYE